MFSLFNRISGWLPAVMSVAALIVLFIHSALYGVAREVDEGAVAHIWQLLMVAQIPVMAYFALKWLPRRPRQAIPVVAVQIASALAAAAPVYFLGL